MPSRKCSPMATLFHHLPWSLHQYAAGDSGGGLSVAALAERVGDFNVSMDPWERTEAAPQGSAPHLHQTVIPVQRYIQLRPQDTTLPSFGSCLTATAGTENEPTQGMTLISHSIVFIPVPPSRFDICARSSSIVIVERCIPYIRQSLPLNTVNTFFCLPSRCM